MDGVVNPFAAAVSSALWQAVPEKKKALYNTNC
jgi:hypothetical protein